MGPQIRSLRCRLPTPEAAYLRLRRRRRLRSYLRRFPPLQRLLPRHLTRSPPPPPPRRRPLPSLLRTRRLPTPTFRQLFLTPLNGLLPSDTISNDVAVDYLGNAYVTDSANDVIFKVTEDGEATILSRSKAFKSHPVDSSVPYHNCGLNGIVFNPKGYLLVTQSNTGKLFKVDVDDGTARRVILNKDLTGADGIALRSDGVVVVVSAQKLYFIKSDDSWSEGVVFDETALEEERQASAVAVGAENRVYALYGHVNEGITGNAEREEFSIVEVESEEEQKRESLDFIFDWFGFCLFLVLEISNAATCD
ncbi:UNVERIFIED_CONTAM: hypothetical protein Scaly_0951900 [Sesamum calycinum]|uniref:Uncharacterized protein n=1 Tax=Sesamum calycinum TaxID=2727403 RepID=A0AAW2QY11_9LAMI